MNERGVLLLEVLIAVAILSIVAASAMTFLVAVYDGHGRVHAREVELWRAERMMAATSLLTRRELEQRIGMRKSGEFVVYVDRPAPNLFRLGVAPASRPRAEILATLVYRRPTSRDSLGVDGVVEPNSSATETRDAEVGERGLRDRSLRMSP